MVALCRAARLPARVVTGFRLEGKAHTRTWHWVQVYRHGVWADFDPTQGYRGNLPRNYVAFVRDGPLLATHGVTLQAADYRISKVDVPPSIADNAQASPLKILNLARLPFSARATLATLLLLPLGALLNTFVRLGSPSCSPLSHWPWRWPSRSWTISASSPAPRWCCCPSSF